MVKSQTGLIVDTARARKLPTLFPARTSVVGGNLAGNGVSDYAAGRLEARHLRRLLPGTSPSELPVERIDRLELVIYLKTARAPSLTIPPSLLRRADEVAQRSLRLPATVDPPA